MAVKTASKNKEFISVPRESFEEFLKWKKIKSPQAFISAAIKKWNLLKNKHNYEKDNYITLLLT